MKLTYLAPCLALALINLAPAARAQELADLQSSGSQTFPGENPPPSTAATPAEAKAKGVPPATAPTATTATTTTKPVPATIGTGTTPSTAMSTIVVEGTPDNSILPTDQTVTSVFGTDLSVQDTPRSVTAVSSQLLQTANITDLSDFEKVAPSAYTTDQFGVASVPTIRGQAAEVYINGMQRTTRGDGPPTSFNSVEQANIVAGPASSIYGPTANTGGYVDLITKQPFFDRFHDDTEFTYGSYDTKRWTEDFGGPIIKDQLAYRVSYEGDYSGSYYNNVSTESNDFFGALAWTPNKDFRVDFNTETYVGNFNELTGINRPTQGLIDGLQYSTGTYNPGTGTINSPGTTRISPSSTLISPQDSDYGKDINAELKETYNINDNLTLVNHTYYEYFELRNSEYAQLYVNAQNSNIVQDRLELHIDFDTPIGDQGTASAASDPKDVTDAKSMKYGAISAPIDFKSEIITGIAGKYVNLIGYGDFFNEFLNATDLSTNTYPEVNNQSTSGLVYAVPGKNFSAIPGTFGQPNTTGEKAYEASAFFQHQIQFTKQWTLIYSGRMDAIFDDLYDPLGGDIGNTAHAVTSQVLGTADVSLSYKPWDWVTAYATCDYNQSTPGNSAGGFDTYSNGGQSVDYHYNNYLYETGVKFDLLDHTLFTTADGYYQTHNTTTVLGTTSEIRTLGAELSTTYQPDKHLAFNFNESYLNATVVNPGAEFTENVYDAFTTTSSGVNGTNAGSPNFTALPTGHYREGGLPQFLLTGLASYTFDNGFGASAGYVITDPIPTSELGNVWIPWQYEIDASLYYKHKDFSAAVTFFNVTDQTNFSTGGYNSGSGNDLITVKEPFHVEGTIAYKF